MAAVAFLLLAAVAVCHSIAGLQEGLLSVLPALLLLVALLGGRYPGERVLKQWRTTRRSRPREATARLGCSRPLSQAAARGGLLIAASLAGRAPPLVASCR